MSLAWYFNCVDFWSYNSAVVCICAYCQKLLQFFSCDLPIVIHLFQEVVWHTSLQLHYILHCNTSLHCISASSIWTFSGAVAFSTSNGLKNNIKLLVYDQTCQCERINNQILLSSQYHSYKCVGIFCFRLLEVKEMCVYKYDNKSCNTLTLLLVKYLTEKQALDLLLQSIELDL